MLFSLILQKHLTEFNMTFFTRNLIRMVLALEMLTGSWIFLQRGFSVTSGVPQGTILGPILFVCFINDISDNIQSTIRLYADDCILYRSIHTEKDCTALQSDLNLLSTDRWKLSFNVWKCKVMNLSRKRHFDKFDYYIADKQLMTTTTEIYLGVVINKKIKLEWSLPRGLFKVQQNDESN